MTELLDKQIAMFMEVSGLDYETASLTLNIHNYNLEQAINFHLERSLNENDDGNVSTASSSSTGAAVAPQNGTTSAASNSTSTSISTSTLLRQDATASMHSTAIPLNEDDNVRAPIPPKREQMILPDEDNFRFRKRRVQPPRSVCPLRNFELEGRLQEARIQAAVRHNFVSNNLGGNEKDDDNDGTFRFAAIPTAPTQKAATVISSDQESSMHSFRSSKSTTTKLDQGMPSRLSDLYRPPVDISFCGSFQAARDYAKDQNRWLIVNVQDNSDFNCQVLNRDIWSNERLREIMKRFFVFWQVAIDNSDGHRYQVFYGIDVFPYIGIIDPRTGEEKFSYKNGFKRTVSEFLHELQYYLEKNTAHPNMDLAVLKNNSIVEVDFMSTNDNRIESSTKDFDTSGSPFKFKRRKLGVEPSSLSEQEQIALAIGNSLREVVSKGGGAGTGESGDDASDVSDEDDDADFDIGSYSDDERSTQSSVAKEPQSQAKVEDVFEGKSKPVTGAITYECYLGNENDPKARIQLRLPDGNRHTLEWPCSTKMKALKLYIPFKYPEITTDSPYRVICPFGAIGGASQPSNVLDFDDSLTLKEASLYPTVILHLRNDE